MSSPSPSVRVWVEQLSLPTYPVGAPDPNPMFFETRNIQGAKGNIYPHPFTDQLSSEKVMREYEAVYLENEYIQLILLPEIGGRIFAGKDKTNGYDFFYRHTVIKPALIGVFGPWISGGVEFNWPQHHRPTTFDPVDYTIEQHADGSATVWLSEHDPLNRTKGMVGICLYPGKALVETKVRLYNRTPISQTFLWWENAAVHINDQYQVIFPPDVYYAVYHTKNPVIRYPIAQGAYLSNDYGPGADVSWWVNSPQATSFFAGESKYEFFGGYDHARQAGVVHVAEGGISPGKKFFTWGNGPFGHSWQKALMDDEGEYLELMAGVYTDNQPDFSWIRPYETITFSQFWYPIQKIGGIKNANLRAAVNLEKRADLVWVGVYATEAMTAQVTLTAAGQVLLSEWADLAPGSAYLRQVSLSDTPAGIIQETDLLLCIVDEKGEELIRYQPEAPRESPLPAPYQPVEEPEKIGSVEELYLAGLHLEQYRHPALSPRPYWEEALRRDAGESRCHIALGRERLRCADFQAAETHFRQAVQRLTRRNYNPFDGEAHYHLGLALQYQNRLDEAYAAFAKATWSYPWRSAGLYALAQIDCRRGAFQKALEHLKQALQTDPQNHKARNLMCAVLRTMRRDQEAYALATETLTADALDHWARYEQAIACGDEIRLERLKTLTRGDVQTHLDIAFDYANAGLWQDASDWLSLVANCEPLYPMVAYTLGYFAYQAGNPEAGAAWYRRGAAAEPDYCFPWRWEEMIVLQDVLAKNPADGRASYYLGNLLYDKGNYAEAIRLWKQAVEIEPDFAIPWRNLGLASFNREQDIDQALRYYERAWQANPQDPRLLLEYDQLRRRKGFPPQERLAMLEASPEVVNQRDDLIIEVMALYNRLGMPDKTLNMAAGRAFHAWEGGEGKAAVQYANAHWLLGRKALEAGDPARALAHFDQGLDFPENLGVVPFASEVVHLSYYRGLALEALGRLKEASDAFALVSATLGSFHGAYYRALALRKLGQEEKAEQLLQALCRQLEELIENGPPFNYFYSGKPSPVFEDDLKHYNRPTYLTALGLARLGLGDTIGARNAFMQALALNPANLFAYEELRRLQGS